ncbi:putative leucine-rich repeat-containing, plant-type, leucine-rich repeat domain, L [Medicago truncatula]|uniref:Putative leucine-rich repeat-containing, plant-type, leucine-rich repeat domain, L n=1 Tax=Medicago truncatula TaxID=3880 RepID=A0A072VKG1_MEDTR|nr:receptor-like protein 33 [Medicago truncatula]KEH38645.1 verticillium wilt disease resistance protein [Medicago truncatula]RHN75002.1 putative leucine-rich repeat-containing, plant-type, leucine-rich repeat domain, L [Medicago truncatula]
MRTILLLPLLPFCLINLIINIVFVTSHSIGDQQSLLLQLKNNLTFNSTISKKLVHWNISKPCCEWNGVTCNNKGHVIALDLSHEFINGKFPIEIFQIPSLQVLDVSYNLGLHGSLPNFPHQGSLHNLNLSHTNFSGPIPDSIHNLRQLSTLDLSNCQFNGTLPSSMSHLTNLVHLDLSFNNFIGPLPSFNRSKSLKVLSLNHNDFNGTIPSTHFEGLVNLMSIDLGDNSFEGRVPSTLFRLQSLQQLMLYYNKFEGVLEEFPNASMSLLEMLDLSGNNFEGSIPMSTFKLKRLRLLQLTKNKFNGTIQLDVFGKLQNLTTLDLGHNNLFVDANIKDGSEASSFPSLKTLWLPSCNLKAFPDFLKYKSSMLYLDLANNQISGKVPNWIWRFDSMVILNISYNSLTYFEGPLHNLSSNLFKLDLHSNQFQGLAPTFLKNAIYLDYSSNRFNSINLRDIESHMPFLYYLSLSNNSFHGTIHESFCNISGLKALDLSYNSFNGNIPMCLLRRSSTLRLLNLGGNKLNGPISDTFSKSCDLRLLDLSGNLLKGTLPKSLANCKHLQVLNLGKNQLIDEFPCFLRKISSLRVMILRTNKLHGNIECPKTNGNWETLQIVDLAKNNFSGSLPPSLLQSWKALMIDEDKGGKFGHLFFNLYDNFNPTNVQTSIVDLNSELQMKLAKVIAAEPPYLLDHIVSHIFEEGVGLRTYEDSVTIVNKGTTMNLVKILIAFTSLDFSSNNFEGPIPKELMNLSALHALNLSQNAFSGKIPSSLSNLRYLESLDLSMNSLSGEIPTELASLSFLAVMNLSYNHLVGRIPTGTQIQSFQADSFIGNEGLFGPPLTPISNGQKGYSPEPEASETHDESSNIDWNFLSAELGFTFGFGILILPLILWKRWRMWYSKKVDDMLYRIIPQLDFVLEHHGGKKYRTLRWKPY